MLKKIVVVLGFNLALLVIFDMVLWATGLFPPKYWYGNELTGVGFEANSKATILCEDYPGGKFLQITNSYGFKEVEETVPSFPGIRVLFLGDSHMNGICANHETMSSQFEIAAKYKSTVHVDSQNGGFGGLSPAQYARVLQFKGVPISPDIVVVGIYTGNDFFDLLRKDDRPWVKLIDNKLVWQEPEWVTLKGPDFKESISNQSRIYWIGYELFNHTVGYTYSRAKYLFDSAPEQASLTSIWKFLNVIRKGRKYGKNWWNQVMTQHLYFRMFNKIDESDRLMGHIIKLYKSICDENSIRLVIAPIPTAFEIHPDGIRSRYEELRRELPEIGEFHEVISFLSERMKKIQLFCEKENIEFYDLRIPLKDRASTSELYYPNDFHINPAGNFFAANYLVEKLLTNPALLSVTAGTQ